MTNPASNSTQSVVPKAEPKNSKLKKVAVPAGIVFAGVAGLAILTSLAPKPEKKPLQNKAPLVEVVEVTRGDVVFEIESQGSVMPRTETTLVSEVSGMVKNVSDKFVVGGFFKKGELLLEIDPISYEVALLQAQARLDGANARLVEEAARGKQSEKEWRLTGRKLSEAPILALRHPQLQQAEADVKAAEADVRNAQIKLERTKIIAPYDAMVKAKMVDIGQFVSTGTQLATTFAIDYAEIRLPVKEQDFAYIDIPKMGSINQQGSPVELTFKQGRRTQVLQSFITRSEGMVDASSRVNYVVAHLNDPYGLLAENSQSEPVRMGTFVKAKIYSEVTPNVITIPRKAVRGANALYLVNDERKLDFATVNILRSDNQNIFVDDGVTTGDKIIVTKLSTPVEGMSLRLKGELSESQSVVASKSLGDEPKTAQDNAAETQNSQQAKDQDSQQQNTALDQGGI